MASPTLSYTYRYPFGSEVDVAPAAPEMRLATSLDGTSDDLFFDGRLRQPVVVARMLGVLCDTVRTRFYQPIPANTLDPVVTSGGGMLRFEGFSSCCGVYARVDLTPDAFDADLRGKGTTNVDFNEPMRTALRRITSSDDAALQVGGTGVTLSSGEQQIVERKVKLPVRWIKGFSEVQAYQPRLVPQFELDPPEVRELLRGLPKRASARWFVSDADRAGAQDIVARAARVGADHRSRPGPDIGAAVDVGRVGDESGTTTSPTRAAGRSPTRSAVTSR